MRARDALGRPVPVDDPSAVEPVSEEPLPPAEALAEARRLLGEGRAFSAHEVLEASWKAAPEHERELWQGLAQLCVGATHWQRGNLTGAVRLLQRGAGGLLSYGERARAGESHGLDVTALAARAREQARRIEAGEPSEQPVVEL